MGRKGSLRASAQYAQARPRIVTLCSSRRLASAKFRSLGRIIEPPGFANFCQRLSSILIDVQKSGVQIGAVLLAKWATAVLRKLTLGGGETATGVYRSAPVTEIVEPIFTSSSLPLTMKLGEIGFPVALET